MSAHTTPAYSNLAEMLCTRLCHDLTGPIGAVNNGAEFLEDEGFDMQSEAMQLVLSSAAEAVHRLQFYRQAYGRTGEQAEVSLAQQKQLVDDFFSATKIRVQWPQLEGAVMVPSVSQKAARLILNLLIIASGCLIKGGGITVQLEEAEGDHTLVVLAKADTIKIDESWINILRGESVMNQLTPKTAQLALTLQLAQELGGVPDIQVQEGELRITVPLQEAHSDAVQAHCA